MRSIFPCDCIATEEPDDWTFPLLPQPIAELEHKKDEAQRALEEAKRKEAVGRPPEWYVILMGITGAIVGYFSALAFKFVGRYALFKDDECGPDLLPSVRRYVLYFAAAETTALLMLTATGAITRNTAIEVAKFTMPPFEWALRTALDLIRGEFRRAFSSSSLSLRLFFLLSFGLTLRYSRAGPQGPFFFGRK